MRPSRIAIWLGLAGLAWYAWRRHPGRVTAPTGQGPAHVVPRPPRTATSAFILIALLVLVAAGWVGTGAYYAAQARAEQQRRAIAMTGGDPGRAPALIERFGCGGCHVIPGIQTASGRVGPPLVQLVHRRYIAGVLANTPENLVAWLVDPQAILPGNAMPRTGVTPAEARDIAAYLYAISR